MSEFHKTTKSGNHYGHNHGDCPEDTTTTQQRATTTVKAPTTTVKATTTTERPYIPPTTEKAPTTTEASTTTTPLVETTTTIGQVVVTVPESVASSTTIAEARVDTPAIEVRQPELAETGAFSQILAIAGVGAVALGLTARHFANRG